MSCIECKFWDGFDRRGNCHRHAPIRIGADVGERDADYAKHAVWPSTLSDDWCGDFVPDED